MLSTLADQLGMPLTIIREVHGFNALNHQSLFNESQAFSQLHALSCREKERQLRISISWFGKDLEASFFQNAQENASQAQLAGSNM